LDDGHYNNYQHPLGPSRFKSVPEYQDAVKPNQIRQRDSSLVEKQNDFKNKKEAKSEASLSRDHLTPLVRSPDGHFVPLSSIKKLRATPKNK